MIYYVLTSKLKKRKSKRKRKYVYSIRKNLLRSGPTQFKPMLLKGQLYI